LGLQCTIRQKTHDIEKNSPNGIIYNGGAVSSYRLRSAIAELPPSPFGTSAFVPAIAGDYGGHDGGHDGETALLDQHPRMLFIM
ncbi:MAG: hypothetical protein KAG97_02250, partial [Victivallales bacterium]|nr:hypothetical protein [Victivallales bacterium]